MKSLQDIPTVVQRTSGSKFYLKGYFSVFVWNLKKVGFLLVFFAPDEPLLLYVAVPCLGAGGFTLLDRVKNFLTRKFYSFESFEFVTDIKLSTFSADKHCRTGCLGNSSWIRGIRNFVPRFCSYEWDLYRTIHDSRLGLGPYRTKRNLQF